MKHTLPLLAALLVAAAATLHRADPVKPNVLFVRTGDRSFDTLSVVQGEQREKGGSREPNPS